MWESDTSISLVFVSLFLFKEERATVLNNDTVKYINPILSYWLKSQHSSVERKSTRTAGQTSKFQIQSIISLCMSAYLHVLFKRFHTGFPRCNILINYLFILLSFWCLNILIIQTRSSIHTRNKQAIRSDWSHRSIKQEKY